LAGTVIFPKTSRFILNTSVRLDDWQATKGTAVSGDKPVDAPSGHQDAGSAGPLRLEGRRLAVARAAWVIIALASIAAFVAGVPLRYQGLLVPCMGDDCAMGQLAPEALLALQNTGFSPALYAAFIVGMSILIALVYIAVGLFIYWHQSREWMALLGSLWLVTFGATLFEGEVNAVAASYPLLEPLVRFLTLLGGVLLLQLFLFIFPNGRFVPRWMRWLYLATMTFFTFVFVFLEFFSPSVYAALEPSGSDIWTVMVLSGVVAQVYRYLRVSGPIERQQTKWVVFGLLTFPLALVAFFVFEMIRQPFDQPGLAPALDFALEITVATIAFIMIPVTIGFSILRYRLWDTDIIINRTLVYGLLTVVLALLYFASVLLFQQVTQALTGQSSPLAIVVSTLLIAALFQPLRHRLQDLIDRRFYRSKYDAAQTLEQFAVTARDEVDLDRLAAEIVRVVEEAMQPEKVTVWLREKSKT
jgi:hypothetical protein